MGVHTCVLIVLCIISTVQGITPSLTNSTIKIKELNLLGAQLTLATFRFTFDADLYIHESNYCSAFSCLGDSVNYTDQANCICDFTNENNCTIGYVHNDITTCSCYNSLCNTNLYDWTAIRAPPQGSQTLLPDQELQAGEIKHYRAFLNSGCKGLRISVTSEIGTSTLFVSNKGPATAQNSNWKKTNEYEKEEIFICPTDQHFVEGTYFIAVAATTASVFSLAVEELMVAQPNNTYVHENCTDEALLYAPPWMSVECLMDGVPTFNNKTIEDYSSQIPMYYFNVTFHNGQCTPVFVAVQSYTPGATTTLEISIPSESPDVKWTSTDRESFVLCPKNAESWVFLQINLLSTNDLQWDYRLTVSTSYFENHWTHTLLSDIPVSQVNFDLFGSVIVHTDPYPVEFDLYFTGNSYESVPNYVLKCTNWKQDCKTLSFTTTENPLFPVPPIVLNLPGVGDIFRTVEGNYSIEVPPVDPRSFTIVVVLSYETNTFVLNIPESGVEEISVEFQGKVGSMFGETLRDNFTATLVDHSCQYSEYQNALSEIQKTLDELSAASSTSEITTLRYKLDSQAYQDSFAFCSQFVDDLTIGVTSQNFTIESYHCSFESGTPEWYNDPCCNQAAVWLATCFPQFVTGPIPQYEVQKAAVKNVCKNVECSESYLEDYSSAKSAFEAGQCSVDLNQQKLRKEEVQKQYLKCKELAFPFAGENCLLDSDCLYPPNNITYSCGATSKICLVPYEVMEVSFMECLRGYLTESQALYLSNKYNFTAERSDPLFTDLWIASVTTSDCVSLFGNSPNLEHRQKISTVPLDFDCAEAFSCVSYDCEDSSCPYPDMSCHYACGMAKSKEESSEVQCVTESICNWDSALCEDQPLSNCTSLCETPSSHFCGFCDAFSECTQFPEILTSEACASTSVCLLPNGTYLFNISDSQCDSYSECNLPYCGLSCVARDPMYSDGLCYSYEDNSTACTDKGGDWTVQPPGLYSPEPYLCIYNVNSSTLCANYEGYFWESCPEMELYWCASCSSTYCFLRHQNLMSCGLVGNPCADSDTCTNAGLCSDNEFLLDLTSSTQRFGGCLEQRTPSTDVFSFPSCPAERIAVPKACMYPDTMSNEGISCANLAMVSAMPTEWQTPAQDKDTCEEQKGCLEMVNDQQRFSLKDEDNCTESTGDEWKSIWEWKQGRWTGGIKRALAWTPRQAFAKYNWTSTLNFIQVQEDFYGSAAQDLAFDSKSAALCQYQRTLAPMQAVTCDCTDSGSSQCFATDPVSAIAQTQVCSDTSLTQLYSGIRLSFQNDTVSLSCSDLLISKISVRTFESQPEERLLANFIPLLKKDIPQFAIYNDRNVVIGNVLADGVTLTPLAESTLGSFELCIQLASEQKDFEISKKYPVLDFGTTDEKKERVIPLQMLPIPRKFVENSIYDGSYLCATISNLTAEQSYFAIERKSDYENAVEPNPLSPTAEILTYTLAAMFLLASVITSGQLLFYLYSYFFTHLSLLLEHFLVVFIWLFVSVRTIYFFLVAAGFESAVADYVLVALPTFFYFTAFSIIVVLWAVVASKRFTTDVTAFKKTINRILFGTNSVLYAIFLALVLAFQFAKSTSESPCSGRQEADDNSSELKRNISIAYGLIIAIISFLIGVLFLIFGLRLRTFIVDSQSHFKIFVVTAICSVCFVLHSVFIVVVSFLETPNLYFSFCGLVVTEWFPAIFILSWLFVQRSSSMSGTSRDKTSGPRPARSISPTGSKTEDRHTHSAVELHQLDN